MSTSFKRLFGPLFALILALSFVLPAGAQNGDPDSAPIITPPSVEPGPMVDESTNLWFVELSAPPTMRGGNAATIRQEKNRFRGNAQAVGLQYRERQSFERLFNGFSIEIPKTELNVLSRIDGVKAIYPVVAFQHEPVTTINPDLATAINMTGANTVQSEMGYTGAGIKVAVMDTGIDYNHPDLGGSGVAGRKSDFPNSRVITGYDFVGDAFSGPASTPQPDNDPDDCNGHGTHVAGIIGANGQTRGVAPDVKFGAYKVFGCEGSTTADIMLAAMERAAADGMHILNMSIGSAFMTWPQYPTAAGADLLAERGVIVVASIGNSGANGVYSAGAPGVGRKVIGVASFDNSHISALTFRTNPANTQMAYLQMADSATAPTSGTTAEVVYVGRGCSAPDVPTTDPYLADPAGKVALIDRGACTFDSKYQRAVTAGAVGVVVANNATGLFSGGGIVNRGVWAVAISQADGNTLKSQISAGPVTLTWTNERINAPNPTGGMISSFSSYGLTAELDLKPNIGAPGGLIRAPYPLEKQGGYAILSGTSMSSPHVAGTAALLLQAKPGLNWEQVRTRLQNSAVPVPLAAAPSLIETVHRQGAGMVQIDRAIKATTFVTPSQIAVNDLNPGPINSWTRTLTLTNTGSEAVTYNVSHVGAVATGGETNAPSLFLANQTASFSASSVTVPAGGTATVNVTVNIPSPQFGRQYGGYFVFTKQGGTAADTLRVPYAGFQGNYLDIQVLVPTANGFPWLAKLQDGFFYRQQDGATYTMANGDIPYVVAHFRHQSRRLEITLLDAATGQPVTKKGNVTYRPLVIQENYLPRNSTAGAIFSFAWDGRIDQVLPNGKVANRAVPDGQYQLQLRVLKALGDASNPAHWETWTSPVFMIERP